MKKIYLSSFVGFTLFVFIAHYMLVDEDLSDLTKSWLEKSVPTQDLNNNVFIHLNSLGESDADSYTKSRNQYIRLSNLAKSQFLDYSQHFTYPNQLISDGELPSTVYCYLKEEGCRAEIRNRRDELTTQLVERISVVENFVHKVDEYNYGLLDGLVARGSLDGFYALSYLVSLSAYFDILDGNLIDAEQLLVNYFRLTRKLAESSLDMETSIVFVISLETIFQPLLEELAANNHKFTLGVDSLFYELDMREISFQKLPVKEVMYMHRAITSYLKPENYVDGALQNEWAMYVGYKPLLTLNLMSEFWLERTVPETTPKNQYLAVSKNEINQYKVDYENSINLVLSNPRNFIGDLLLAASVPRFINAVTDYASGDLNLLLFKLLIKSQTTPLEELLNDPQYLDPYTGNKPYLDKGKICYPGWPELADDDGNFDPICIKSPNLSSKAEFK